MNKFLLSLVVIALLVGAYILYIEPPQEATEPVSLGPPPEPPAPRVIAPPPPQEPPAPEPRQFPLPEVVEEQVDEPVPTLPELDESDLPVEQEFTALIGDGELADLLQFRSFVRNFVVVVDNMTARILPQKYLFFEPPPGKFQVERPSLDEIYLDPGNYQRYAPYVALANSVDIDEFLKVYVYLYPLFQRAYEELGYPDRYFNDRLVSVLDHLLATPEVKEPPRLVQPKVYYEFEDPELESLSAGQKLLIRIGPENSAVIRTRLQALRERLTALSKEAGYTLSGD